METSIKDSSLRDDKVNKTGSVLLKTERLASALYLITNFISDQDPLKWQLRDRALTALADMRQHQWPQAVFSIQHLLSLIDVILTSGLVSEMNFSLVKKEYQNLLLELSGLQTNLEHLMEGPKEIAEIPRKYLAPKPRVSSPSLTPPAADNSPRRELILKVIRQKGAPSIKDIAKEVPQLGNKTIQRQLAELVREGVLKKEGDRRWSRYLLT